MLRRPLLAMSACLVGGIADLGVLNVVVIPRALSSEEGGDAAPAAVVDEPARREEKVAQVVEQPPAPVAEMPVEKAREEAAAPSAAPSSTSAAVAVQAPAKASPAPQEADETAPAAQETNPRRAEAPAKEAPRVRDEASDAAPAVTSEGAVVVYFGLGVEDIPLSGDVRQKLSGLVDELERDPENVLLIEGHADRRGAARLNYHVAAARARAVAAWARALGVSPRRLQLRSWGEEKLVDPAPSSDGGVNRRVEVRIVRGRQ